MEFYGVCPTDKEESKLYNGRTQDDILKVEGAYKYYSYTTLVDQCASAYTSLIDQKLWSLNVGICDSMAAPKSLFAEVNALIQKTMANLKEQENKSHKKHKSNNNKVVICFYCIETGHYKNEFPKL